MVVKTSQEVELSSATQTIQNVTTGQMARGTPKPGTPRKTKKEAPAPKPYQDAELRDYQLGDCLGKGAFGSVYRALNMNTGEAVAVKQVRLADLPKSELRVITLEIDLLKNLDHPNIVKYHGFVKTAESLNIILEYCENGSLHSISKNFGKFPENLVGLYMTQVLNGLLYLHEQGVIHRDIKGANILTTKQGLVKLADFGVATRTTTLSESSVVGTPYWMAPEVIELSGASTASDIWSLGCTVIELLDGKPPYHKLQPMHALFRIVNDDHPPLPEGASPIVRDFLMQCFQKDPNLRVSARKLLKHPWIVNAKRTDAVVPKKPTEYNEAVKSVQQWNDALKSPESTLRRPTKPAHSSVGTKLGKKDAPKQIITPARSGPSGFTQPRDVADEFRSPDSNSDNNWDNDFATGIDANALHLPHLRPQDQFGGMFSAEKLKTYASFEATAEKANWNEDFEGSLTVKTSSQSTDPLKTVRPIFPPRSHTDGNHMGASRSPKRKISQVLNRKSSKTSPLKPSLVKATPPEPAKSPAPKPTLQYREDPEEDYSDLILANDGAFDSELKLHQKRDIPQPQLFHPSDMTNTPRGGQPPFNGSLRQPRKKRSSSIKRTRSSVEIQRYAEDDDDEDFSDILGRGSTVSDKAPSEKDSDTGTLMLNSKLSNKSWLGDEDDEDDPFAQLEEGFDEMDLEANVARDKYARLCTQVESLVGELKQGQADDMLADISEDLLEVLCDSPETKQVIISAHGMLPILEILEVCKRRDVVFNLLKIVNIIIQDDVEVQENVCFVGGIPIITKFASSKYSSNIRLEAAAFVRKMCQTSILTLQMFVSAGGLKVLVEFLEEDYEDERDLVMIGVNGLWSVFENTGPLKNEFCRILSRSQVLDPLSLVLSRVLDESGEFAELCESRIANIFLLFSQAENHVKELVAERSVLHRVLKELKRMSPAPQITMLKFIKNISMLSTTLDALQNANAIDVLTELLRTSMREPHFREISNQVLNTIYNLCRLNKPRQADAAMNDIIPILQRIYKTERPLKEFVLPILCDMAHAGRVGRRELWRNKGLQFYVSLLSDPYWQVTGLDSIFIWLQEETARVEEHLIHGNFPDAIMDCFINAKANSFENLLEPLQKLLRLSPPIASNLARPELFSRILQKLNSNKALTRLNLLRIVQSICDASDEQGALINVHGLYDTIQKLAESDTAILVRDMAGKLIRSCNEHELLLRSGGKRRTTRRTSTSTTPPGLNPTSQSMPPTPTSTRSQSTYFDRPGARSIINGSIPYRGAPAREDDRLDSPISNGVNNTATKSRLPRTSTRSSRPSVLLSSVPPTKEETSPRRDSVSSSRRESMVGSQNGFHVRNESRNEKAEITTSNSRRRRQTSAGEGRWT